MVVRRVEDMPDEADEAERVKDDRALRLLRAPGAVKLKERTVTPSSLSHVPFAKV